MTNFLNNLWDIIGSIPQRISNWWNPPPPSLPPGMQEVISSRDKRAGWWNPPEMDNTVVLPNFQPRPMQPIDLDENLVTEREPFYGGGARNRPPSPSRYFDDRLDTDIEPLYGGRNPWQPQQPQPYKSFNGPWDDVAPYQPPPNKFVKPFSGPKAPSFWDEIYK